MPQTKTKKRSWSRSVRKTRIEEARAIQKLIEPFARQGEMLPRSLGDIYEFIRDYMVITEPGTENLIGTCALHVSWENIAEIRSLAVREDYSHQGIGSTLVKASLREARRLGCYRVFSLTFKPGFFLRMGFQPIDKRDLPQKVWTECIRCPQFPDCNEEAVVYDIPKEEK